MAYVTLKGSNDSNLMTSNDYRELLMALQNYKANAELRAAVITGSGEKSFTEGDDLERINGWTQHYVQSNVSQLLWAPKIEYLPCAAFREILKLELVKPAIAAVNGNCFGVGMMVLCCLADYRVAAEHAKFGFPDIKRGSGGAGVSPDCRGRYPMPLLWKCCSPVTR